MNMYTQRHAGLYDVFYAEKEYDSEAKFLHRCLQELGRGNSRRLLELACGTGSHAFALERLGYEVWATDCSEDMLACARSKAKKIDSGVRFMHQDMRELEISQKDFDAAVCLFDSIGFAESNEALRKVMGGVHRHLRPEGLFVLEFWHGAAMLRYHDPVRVKRWFKQGEQLVRISETTLDHARQVAKVVYTVLEKGRDGRYDSWAETLVNRYFLVQEMAGWLVQGGLTPIRWFSGYSWDEEITDKTWHVLAVARKDPD